MDLRITKSSRNSLWKILLSATLFNLAFFLSNSLGWLIILAMILLYSTQQDLVCRKSFVQNFWTGFFWGLIAFSLHFIWLYELLLMKSQASKTLSTVIFIFCTFYAAAFSGLWFLLTKIVFCFLRIFYLSFFCSTALFFWFMEKYLLFIFGRAEGYPFFNPLLPLAKYKFFLILYHLIFFNFSEQPELKDTKIFYLKPVSRAGELSCAVVGQMIYQKLSALNLNEYSAKYKNLIVVAPETSFPFSLNKHLEILNFWNNALPSNVHLLIGSQREENGKYFQTFYYIKSRRIINFYDKTHSVAFTEKIPEKWKSFKFSSQPFLLNKEEFHKGNSPLKFFKISEDLFIVPKICSDFFFKDVRIPRYASQGAVLGTNSDKKQKFFSPPTPSDLPCKLYRGDTYIFLFVNDSWFMNYFKQIMENFVLLKQIQLGVPLLYVTHTKALNIGFSLGNP